MSPCTLRSPWPDELPRIAAAFPQLPRLIGSRPLVLVSSGIERLLAAAAVLLPPPAARPEGRSFGFVCAFTGRALLEGGTADRLVAGILALANEERASHVVYAASLRVEDPRCAVLRRAGFAPVRSDELWDIDPRGMSDRLARIHGALTPGGRLRGFTASALTEADLPEVRTLVTEAGLLAAEQIFLAGGAATGGGYDSASSTVVRHEGRLTGVLLARVIGRLSVVEARVVAPGWRGGLNLTNHLLFHRSVGTGLAAGCERLLFTADPQAEAETVRMAQRFGGRLASRNQRWRRDLIPEAPALPALAL